MHQGTLRTAIQKCENGKLVFVMNMKHEQVLEKKTNNNKKEPSSFVSKPIGTDNLK